MAALTIPEQYRSGIAVIGRIETESFSALLTALKNALPSESEQSLAEKIGEISSDLPLEVRVEIISAIASMQGVQKTAHVDTPRFTADIWAALKEDSPKLVKNIDESVLRDRVAKLLNDAPIQLMSIKTAELRREVERRFCSARIMTDARTAFADDTSTRPAITILQTLEIRFHDDTGEHREFYVALDDDDLEALKEVIERAQRKKTTLNDLLTKANFELFE